MPEAFKPSDWDPSKIVAESVTTDKIVVGTIDLSKIVATSVNLSDLVPDPQFPWMFTTRQDLESRRLPTTEERTDSPSPATGQVQLSDPPAPPRPRGWHERAAIALRRLVDLLTRAGGNSGR